MNRIQDSDTDVKHGCPTWLLLYLGFLPKANMTMTWNTRLSSCFPAMFGGAPRVLHMSPRWICPIPPWMDPSTLSKHGQEWNYTSWSLGYNLEISQANFRGFHQPRIKLEGRNRHKIGILHFTCIEHIFWFGGWNSKCVNMLGFSSSRDDDPQWNNATFCGWHGLKPPNSDPSLSLNTHFLSLKGPREGLNPHQFHQLFELFEHLGRLGPGNLEAFQHQDNTGEKPHRIQPRLYHHRCPRSCLGGEGRRVAVMISSYTLTLPECVGRMGKREKWKKQCQTHSNLLLLHAYDPTISGANRCNFFVLAPQS